MNKKQTISRLNSMDFHMMAMNDVFPSLGIVVTIRFKESHSADEIRDAMRFMFTIYPRLRSVLEPTLCSYQLRILTDHEPKLEILFNQAFQVQHDLRCDSEAYLDFRQSFLNEPFAMHKGLLLKIRYLPDDPQPMLLLSLHHMLGDGRSWVHLENSLMRYLNGEKPPPLPLDNPSMLPVFLKKPYRALPRAIYRSYKHFTADLQNVQGHKMISASSRPARFFSAVNAFTHTSSIDLERFNAKCMDLRVSKSVLLLTAFGMVVSQGPAKNTGDVIGIPIPINLRPFFEENPPTFGNYVSLFWIIIPRTVWDNPHDMLNTVKSQMYTNIDHYLQNESIFKHLIEKMQTFLGKKIYSSVAYIAKQWGYLPISCAFSPIGDLNTMNSHGARAQVCETLAFTPCHALFLVTTSMEGRIFLGFTYPETEFSREEIQAIANDYDKALNILMQL